jgi:anaerobic ribonucleoside-triphosphate reductase
LFDCKKKYTRVGLPVYESRQIDLGYGIGDNANLQNSPETGHKRKADAMSKEQNLLMLPTYISDAHLNGDIHIHDLEYFSSRQFCLDSDLRYFFYYGFVGDGKGDHTSFAGPAKRAEVAILHAVKVLGSSQTNCAGGQGFYNFLTFLSPFFEGESEETYYQCMQMFIYEMTQMLVARGGQSLNKNSLLVIKVNDNILLKPIGEFCHEYLKTEGTKIFKENEKNYETLSLNRKSGKLEWKKINGVYIHKPKSQLKETILSDGRSVVTTSDHSLFTLDENCNFIEITPSEKPKTVLVSKEIPFKGKSFDKDLMFLIGACIGDGNLIDNNENINSSISIHVLNEKVMDKITNVVKTFNHSKCNWNSDRDKLGKKTSFSTKNIPYITEIGHLAQNKKIPQDLLSGDDESLYALLDGLISTDGNVARRRYEYNTTSKTLAKQFEFILNRLGLQYGISCTMESSNFNRNYPVYVIRICATDSPKIHVTNSSRQIESWNGTNQQKHDYSSIKPLVKSKLTGNIIRNECGLSDNDRKLKYEQLERISDYIPEIWDKIKSIIPMEVKSIDSYPDKEFVYDVGVDDNENFVLNNGIICHNTVFSSVQLSPGIPELWKDIPVVYKGRVWDGKSSPLRTYGEFEKENRLLFKALMEAMLEGDYKGKPFYFPKPEISIEPQFVDLIELERNLDLDMPKIEELYLLAFELASKFGTPYFDNQIPQYRGAGKGITCYQCSILPDTLIQCYTNNECKIKQIQELFDNNYLVNTPDGLSKFSEISIHEINEEIIEIVIKGGKRIAATYDHKMPIENGDKIKVEKLKIGDKINLNCKLIENIPLNYYKKCNELHFAYLLGLFAAEGTTNNNGNNRHISWCFGANEKDLIKKCKNLIFECFEYDAKQYYVNDKRGISINIHSNDIYDWFIKNNIALKGYSMAVPSMIFTSTKECKMAFLQGYYRGDGCLRKNGIKAKNRRIEINTISKELAEGVLLIAGSLGYDFNYCITEDKRENRKKRHILTLNKQDEIKDFLACICKESLNIWKPIKKLNKIQYHGDVYDIVNVEKNQVFITGQGIVSSNCAYQFSSNLNEDSNFDDKLNFINGAHFSMGSYQVITVNFPRLAYEVNSECSNIDEKQNLMLQKTLEKIDICCDIFKLKKELLKDVSAPFLQQRQGGSQLVDFDKLVYTIGVIGINEVCEILYNKPLYSDKSIQLKMMLLINNIKKYCIKKSNELGITLALSRTPAETTAQRFAVLDLLNYGDAHKFVKGDVKEAIKKYAETGSRNLPIYYTNGTHVPVNANVMLPDKIRIEQAFFPILDGGNICNIYLGEARPDPRGLMDMTLKICKSTNLGYFAYTKDFTVKGEQYERYSD